MLPCARGKIQQAQHDVRGLQRGYISLTPYTNFTTNYSPTTILAAKTTSFHQFTP
jgi:hypothetical protein